MRATLLAALALVAFVAVFAQRDPPYNPPEVEGALIKVTAQARVGIDISTAPPPEADRLRVRLAQQKPDFWMDRAKNLIDYTSYRLNYRKYYFTESSMGDHSSLPLPRKDSWTIRLTGPALPESTEDLDFVAVSFEFETYILSNAESVAKSDGLLAEIGGVVREDFTLPIDPDNLFAKTGFACVNEFENPENSVVSTNAVFNFDDKCKKSTDDLDFTSCHLVNKATLDCKEAMRDTMGVQEVAMRFERVPYDLAIADKVRYERWQWYRPSLNTSRTQRWRIPLSRFPNLTPLASAMHENRVEYRYIKPDDCITRVPGCVSGTGWRRLLTFSTAMVNDGAGPFVLGPPNNPNLLNSGTVGLFTCPHPLADIGLFTDYRYRFYGSARVDGEKLESRIMAPCIEGTSRYLNTEDSPINSRFSCNNWGLEVGWTSEYPQGQVCQWIDITDEWIEPNNYLRFHLNPENLMCEGNSNPGEDGLPTYKTEPMNPDDLPSVLTKPWVPPTTKPDIDTEDGSVDTEDGSSDSSSDDASSSAAATDDSSSSSSADAQASDAPAPAVDDRLKVYPTVCTNNSMWDLDNEVLVTPQVRIRSGGIVTPCSHFYTGEYRDCGFTELKLQNMTCVPGTTVNLRCTPTVYSPSDSKLNDKIAQLIAPIVLRVCEASRVLGMGLPCDYSDRLNVQSSLVHRENTVIKFTCPSARDAVETGGSYGIFIAPFSSGDSLPGINCETAGLDKSGNVATPKPCYEQQYTSVQSLGETPTGVGVGFGMLGFIIGGALAVAYLKRDHDMQRKKWAQTTQNQLQRQKQTTNNALLQEEP